MPDGVKNFIRSDGLRVFKLPDPVSQNTVGRFDSHNQPGFMVQPEHAHIMNMEHTRLKLDPTGMQDSDPFRVILAVRLPEPE